MTDNALLTAASILYVISITVVVMTGSAQIDDLERRVAVLELENDFQDVQMVGTLNTTYKTFSKTLEVFNELAHIQQEQGEQIEQLMEIHND